MHARAHTHTHTHTFNIPLPPPPPTVQVPDQTHAEEPPAKKVKGEIPPSLNLHPKVPTEQMRKGVWSATYGMCSLAPPSPQELTGKETTALKQLIRSYRESAGFLLRAAEQLEQTLPKPGSSSSAS